MSQTLLVPKTGLRPTPALIGWTIDLLRCRLRARGFEEPKITQYLDSKREEYGAMDRSIMAGRLLTELEPHEFFRGVH